jgi:hypothetical protein
MEKSYLLMSYYANVDNIKPNATYRSTAFDWTTDTQVIDF